jgi:hypothetical protein
MAGNPLKGNSDAIEFVVTLENRRGELETGVSV